MATESINSTQRNTFKIPKWLHKRRKHDPDSIHRGVNANTQQNFLKKEVGFMFKKFVIKACSIPKNDRRVGDDDCDRDHDQVDLEGIMLQPTNGVELDRPVKVLSVTPSRKKVNVLFEDEDIVEKGEEVSKGEKKKIHDAIESQLRFSRLSIKSKVWRRMNPKLHNKSKELNFAGSNVNGAGTHITRKQLHNPSKPPPLVNDPPGAEGETTRSTLGQILLELHNSKVETWNHQKMSVREDQSNCSKPKSEEEESQQLWDKRILMGMKCRPLPSPEDL